MLEATPKNFLSNDFVVRSSDREIAMLDISVWREQGEFELDGVPHRVYREGLMSGAFILERVGVVIARATKPSALRSRFELEMGGRSYSLRKPSIFSRDFALFSGETQIGLIRRPSFWTRRTQLELPPDWTPALQVFVFWLALVIWKREQAAAS